MKTKRQTLRLKAKKPLVLFISFADQGEKNETECFFNDERAVRTWLELMATHLSGATITLVLR